MDVTTKVIQVFNNYH